MNSLPHSQRAISPYISLASHCVTVFKQGESTSSIHGKTAIEGVSSCDHSSVQFISGRRRRRCGRRRRCSGYDQETVKSG